MSTIVTQYRGPTNTRGSRITAKYSIGGGQATVNYDHGKGSYENHQAAVLALLRRSGIDPAGLAVVSGDWPNGYVFIVGSQYTVERLEV